MLKSHYAIPLNMDNFEVFSHFFPFWISICILYDRLETLLQLSLYLICISKLFPFSSLQPSIKLQKQCCSTTAPSVIYYRESIQKMKIPIHVKVVKWCRKE